MLQCTPPVAAHAVAGWSCLADNPRTVSMAMDRAILRTKIFWQLQPHWHLRHHPLPTLSLQETVKGLQALLLAAQGTMLASTLQHAWARVVALDELSRLDIALYQEGREQRVWRAQATLADGTTRPFGIIVARAPGASSVLTQHDFHHLQRLHRRQPRYCVAPYICGTLPVAGGVAAYTVEWLDLYKELVFEVSLDGGVFLVNAHGAHRRFSPQESRQIWRRLVEVLWWYPGLCAVNIQAGDFVGRCSADGQIELKLTTARQLTPDPAPADRIQTLLASVITASGYLSDGRQPFDRGMSQEVFVHRMQAVLRRRGGDRALYLARQQWALSQAGAFARQEDWPKEDCVQATYDRLHAEVPPGPAWQETCRRWLAYAEAVHARRLPPSWWFPAIEIPAVLERLAGDVAGSTKRRNGEV
jgi:hypothetical protein